MFHFFTQFNPAYGLGLLSDKILFRGFSLETELNSSFGEFFLSKWQIIIRVYSENLQSRMCHLNATVLSARVAREGGACRHLYTLAVECRRLHITVLVMVWSKVTLLVYSVRQDLWQTPIDVTTWPKPELPVYKVQLLQLLFNLADATVAIGGKCNCCSEWHMHNFAVYTCPFW